MNAGRLRVQLAVAEPAAVLDVHLEAGRVAEAEHGRRQQREGEALLDPAEAHVDAHRDLAGRELARAGLLEPDEHDAGVRRRDEVHGVQSRELHDVRDAGNLERDLAHAPHHGVGAVDRRRLGKLHDREQVLLVLVGDVAALHAAEREDRDHDQDRVDREQPRRARDGAADAAGVTVAGALEQAVEGAEGPAEDALDPAPERVLLRAMGLQQERRERRRERQRVEARDDDGGRDRHGELLVELPGDAAEEGERHEHRREHQRDRDDRARDLAHRLVRRLARRHAVLDVPLDVLDDDDRVVHHDADREHQAEQRQHVDREAEQPQHGERADDRHRHRDQRDQRRAPGLQEQHHHDDHEQDGLEQRLDDRVDRVLDVTPSGRRRPTSARPPGSCPRAPACARGSPATARSCWRRAPRRSRSPPHPRC